MLLAELVDTSAAVAATPSRLAKVAALADCLRRVEPAEAELAVSYLSGELRQRRPGVGWASLRELPAPAVTPTLTLAEVDAAFAAAAAAAGSGSVALRHGLIGSLFGQATAAEQTFLARLVGGELRQGAQAGVMTDAVARAAEVDVAAVRRAAMLAGDLSVVAAAALGGGGLDQFRLQVGRPVQPMLAQTATSLSEALARVERPVVEWKLDGVRVQVHRDGADVAVFTRTLDDVTARMPEVVQAVGALPVRTAILDGEAITLDAAGRPRPFQETASRAASQAGPAHLTPFFFDLLHLDGSDLLDLPAEDRHAAAVAALPAPPGGAGSALWVPRLLPGDAAAFYEDTLARGHEGVVVKDLTAPYEAGRRGAGWLKVKPRHTLDLVVLAAEWGHGRRQGWLSNLHLGARDPAGGFVMLGKTFKGLTDETLTWQTTELLARETRRDRFTVHVRPELVVEIAFDGVQTSPRYPGGMALRFARVLRYRPDKTAAEADTVDTVRRLHRRG